MQTDLAHAGRISVVIPAYNAAAYLADAVRSALEQTAPPHEIIVVDDGSTDGTLMLARSFGVTVISVANAGPSAARNAGTKVASGDYIAYLDADDVWLPEKLAAQLAALAAYALPAFSFTDYRMFDDAGPRRQTSELRAHWAFRRIARSTRGRSDMLIEKRGNGPILYDSFIPPSAMLVRRIDALAIGGFDEGLRVTEDYEFLLRLFNIMPAVVVMQPLLLYRQHAGQATAKATTMKAGFFAVARCVAAAPERYPAGDVRYIAQNEHLRHYRVGLQEARLGQFDEAVTSFEHSLGVRWSAQAGLALLGSRLCRSPFGRDAFRRARTLWKQRPGRR